MSYNPYSRQAKAARKKPKPALPRRNPKSADGEAPPRLVECGIRREGVLHTGHRSHYDLRRSLGWPTPEHGLPTDQEGFVDSTGRFLSREDARYVAIAAGQLSSQWSEVRRPLLSSDLSW